MKEWHRQSLRGLALCAAIALATAPAASAQEAAEEAGPSAAAVDVVAKTPADAKPAPQAKDDDGTQAKSDAIDLRLPALTSTSENTLLWVIPATGAVVLAGAASFSLLIGTVNWARFEGARTELLALDRAYTGLPEQDAAIVAARGRYESTRRAYDDVGRGLLGAGLAKLTAAVGLAALAGGAYYWRTLDEEDAASNRASASPTVRSSEPTPAVRASEPAPASGSDTTSEPAPASGNDTTSEPAPASGSDRPSEPAPASGSDTTSEPAPASGGDTSSEPAPASGRDTTREPAPASGSDTTSEPAPASGGDQ